MKRLWPKRLKYRILAIFIVALILNAVISGTIQFTGRIATIREESAEFVQNTAQTYQDHINLILGRVASTAELAADVAGQLPIDQATASLDNAMKKITTNREQPLVQAYFILDKKGTVLAVEQDYVKKTLQEELYGSDLSFLPIVQESRKFSGLIWSSRYISPLGRDLVFSGAVSSENRTILVELSNDALIEYLADIGRQHLGFTQILSDSGEVILDSKSPGMATLANSSEIQAARAVASGELDPTTPVLIGRRRYFAGAVRSEELGWIFFSRILVSLRNPILMRVLLDIAFIMALSLLIIFILVAIFMKKVSAMITALISHAHAVTAGDYSVDWTYNNIVEFDELAESLKMMTEKVMIRETRLEKLNEDLETRIDERTQLLKQKNSDLAGTVQELKRTRFELTRSETQASLGRMVAGVAHELNTPIGNGRMAITKAADIYKTISEKSQKTLSGTDFEEDLEDIGVCLDVAERNLEKTATLMLGFKQVAADQAGNRRRVFNLDDMLKDLFLTLEPMTKRSRHTIKADYQTGLVLETYPGIIGQIIGNLIQNALIHAWDDDESGIITVRTEAIENDVEIAVIDDGHGIPLEIQKDIFTAFFTTRRNRGGTGLGLSIAQNGAENILGGSLELCSPNNLGGTTFSLRIPAMAPHYSSSIFGI